jgi:ABC-2 type transport system ATP-binding protein
MLIGLTEPTSGSVRVLGHDPLREPLEVKRRVGYLPDAVGFYDHLSARENLAYAARLLGLETGEATRRIDDALEQVRLSQVANRRVATYSRGMRQRLGLADVLIKEAELAILDEPTAGLDPLMEVAFRDSVAEARQRGQTIFLSSHILSEVEAICDRVGILSEGRLVDEGTLEQLRHLSAHTVDVTFEGPAPELPALDGVRVQRSGESGLRCEVTGPVRPLLAALAELPVVELSSREPSLEEIFLHHYDRADGGRR